MDNSPFSLIAENARLRKEIEALRAAAVVEARQCPLRACMSRERVKAIVDEMLADPAINMGLVPDAIERRIYENMIMLGMKIILSGIKTYCPDA